MESEKNSKFGKFLEKVGKSFPQIAKIGGSLLGHTPVGVILNTVSDVLRNEAETNEEARKLLLELELDKQEWEQELVKLELQDKDSSRSMYSISKDFADDVAERIMRWNMWVVTGLVLINIFAILVIDYYEVDIAILAVISNVIGNAMQAFIGERSQVVGFYFGSSLTNKKENK